MIAASLNSTLWKLNTQSISKGKPFLHIYLPTFLKKTPYNPKPRLIYFCVSIGSYKTVLHGKVLFSEVNDLFGLHLSDEDVDTIGG